MNLINNIKSFATKQKLAPNKDKLLQSFLKKGFPTTKEEDWKYTSLKKITNCEFSIEDGGEEISEKEIQKHSLGFKHQIVFVNGLLVAKANIDGVNISDFSDFDTKNTDSISLLNSALAKKGFSIKVKDNTIVESPIEILFFSNTTNDNFAQYRNKIIVGDNSQIKFVERIQNLSNAKCFINNFTQINIGENANVEYNKIQDNRANSMLIDKMNLYQLKNANAIVNTLIFGGGFIRNTLSFEQNGSNCESNMNGVSILDNNQFAIVRELQCNNYQNQTDS